MSQWRLQPYLGHRPLLDRNHNSGITKLTSMFTFERQTVFLNTGSLYIHVVEEGYLSKMYPVIRVSFNNFNFTLHHIK